MECKDGGIRSTTSFPRGGDVIDGAVIADVLAAGVIGGGMSNGRGIGGSGGIALSALDTSVPK